MDLGYPRLVVGNGEAPPRKGLGLPECETLAAALQAVVIGHVDGGQERGDERDLEHEQQRARQGVVEQVFWAVAPVEKSDEEAQDPDREHVQREHDFSEDRLPAALPTQPYRN